MRGWIMARRAALGIAVTVLAVAALAGSGAGAAAPPSVLLVYADPRLIPSGVTLDRTLRATIESRSPSPVRLHSEYLGLTWLGQAPEDDAVQAMRRKYAGSTFDLVMPCGEAALRFALREREALFRGVPIVFCAVEDTALEELTLPADVTGVTMLRDWAAALDLILTLQPGTREVVFISGTGPVERGREGQARKTFARYEGRLRFTSLTGLPLTEIVGAVRALPEGTVILFNGLRRDGAGRTFSSPDALEQIAAATSVPIYGLAESQLGHGIVGGPLIDEQAQARRAAELGLRVLDGQRLGPDDIVRREPNRYTFDARELERWHIADSLLPPGSVVEFRTPSPWNQYKWHVLVVLAVVAVQTMLVIGLLIERRWRRRAQRSFEERLRFEMLLADLAAGFVEVPAREIDERIDHGLGRIIQELGLDRAGLAEFVDGGRALRVTHARARAGVPLTSGAFTREAWPWTLGRLHGGHAVCIARLADLPGAAERDRRSFVGLRTRSIVLVPVVVGGAVIGGFGCTMLQREREWPENIVQRLRLLADIFAVVLMRRRADRALAESEGRFQLMAEAAPVMMWMSGPDGRCVDFNRAWLGFTGRTLAQEVGDGWLEAVHPDDRAPCVGAYLTALEARQPFTIEYRLRRADGAYRAVLDSGAPRFDMDRAFVGYVGSAVDVTDLKAGQQALVESLQLRSAIFGSLYGQVAAVDRAGVIIAVNESWTRAMEENGGEARATGLGVNYLDVCRRAAASGDEEARAALDALEGVLAGRLPRALLEYACPGPSAVRWYAMVVEPFRRPEGGLVISHIDVTRQRLAEEEVQREREELAHALRVATLGEMASSLAHEINQPLAAIATNAQAAQHQLAGVRADSEVPEMLRDIAADAQRAGGIIRRLRALFKKEHSERQAVDVGEVIKEVIALLHKDLERRRIRLDVVLQPDVPRVAADIIQLQQVLLNVLLNASEAMTDDAAPRDLHIETSATEPGILAITIRDSGQGVPPAELEHIFERFVSSKPDGLGMGLSISRSIVEAHGGRIWATRNADRGLTMQIELPCLDARAAPKVP